MIKKNEEIKEKEKLTTETSKEQETVGASNNINTQEIEDNIQDPMVPTQNRADPTPPTQNEPEVPENPGKEENRKVEDIPPQYKGIIQEVIVPVTEENEHLVSKKDKGMIRNPNGSLYKTP